MSRSSISMFASRADTPMSTPSASDPATTNPETPPARRPLALIAVHGPFRDSGRRNVAPRRG
jgi:hypothetical protein